MANFKIHGGIIVDYSTDGWEEFKKWLNGTYAKLQYVWVDEGAAYSIVALDGTVYRICSFNKVDAAEFEASYQNVRPIETRTNEGKLITSSWPTEGSRKTFVSHNWCDKTTWTSKAVRVIDEVVEVETPAVYTVYSVDNSNIIDTYHGKISHEEFLTDDAGNNYRVVVKVNDVEKVERDPHFNTGGDYSINYAAGKITFFTALTAPDVVKVTYHYATSGVYTVKPDAGKTLKIRRAEVQFSKDIVIKDTVKFQAYGYVDVFAPHLTPTPYPTGTLIPLGNPTVYKTMMDYINEANGAFPVIPALGVVSNPITDWRNNGQDIVTFPWDYQAMTVLSSAAGMEVRITLEHDKEFAGDAATATFYCLSEDE